MTDLGRRILLALALAFSSGCGGSLRPVSAHRGDRMTGEDNSKRSIASAVRQGAELIEIDIRLSKDEVPYLFHDRRVRAENALGPKELFTREFSSLSSAEIRTLTLRDAGTPPLHLREAFELVRGSRSRFSLDLKGLHERSLRRVLAEVDRAGAERLVVVQCPSFDCLQLVRGGERSALARADSVEEATAMLRFRPEYLQVDPEDLSPSLQGTAHRAGAKVLVRSAGTPFDRPGREGWEGLRDRGADILLTDRPGEIE